AWYSYNGDRIGQGKENCREFLKENPDIADDIGSRLREVLLPAKPKRGEAPKEQEAVAE
ncbi:MAG: hypothetical protein HKN58_06900, partial [Xanthomonadales bacterium]|nr:hypothetical protein [Xanthomonadales bacterium]